ncbi:hypothetical protein BJ123_108135 [Rhodopseudomonas thermotolerans]|uniref:Uncharacterized protein n=2 Tax=Rhodopseudomonas TaxID=1073 RepID=A0A336JM55_9BRAD|nr:MULTISPECIES: hypothetical protein [Rhodopseudomonas]RED36200.1 hypothetical protein BJ125_108135 [Rhodopseudomonas pentothenatexigens]REG03572.1 hypothetical protein BJ123_108135 [Rhodopseudomonas thermotolerans]SSW90760.1 hypothetical protein SAMN05892882_108135 [Rhodopseudomonas pentothenatexigens]
MAQPTPYDRQTSFAQFSAQFPNKQQNGGSLDAEFVAIKVSLDETQANLKRIQADDGSLARNSVGRAQLDSSLTVGFKSPTTWQPSTVYTANYDTVFNGGKFYVALVDHTSGASFDATKWDMIADLSVAAALDDGSVTDAKLADSAVLTQKIADLAITTPKLATGAVTNNKVATGTLTADRATGTAWRDLVIPAGTVFSFTGSAANVPAGFVLAGGTYLRADYPALWALAAAEIAAGGNSWYGVGDGSTTFTIANPAGQALVGVDVGGSVIPGGVSLGAAAGSATKTLITDNLPPYTPSGSVASSFSGSVSYSRYTTQTQIGADFRSFTPSPGDTSLGTGGWTVSGTVTSTFTGSPQGGTSTPLNVVPPVRGVNFIVKAH